VTRDAYYKRLNRGHVQGVEESVVLEFIDKERQDEPRVGTRKLYARLVESGEAALGRDVRLRRSQATFCTPLFRNLALKEPNAS